MQVKQHHEKLQQEREEAGIHKLQASLPKLCRPVLAVALKDCQFDAERALLMLRRFQSDAFDDLAVIHRKRRRLEASAKLHPADPDSASDDDRKRRRHKHSSHDKSKSGRGTKRTSTSARSTSTNTSGGGAPLQLPRVLSLKAMRSPSSLARSASSVRATTR